MSVCDVSIVAQEKEKYGVLQFKHLCASPMNSSSQKPAHVLLHIAMPNKVYTPLARFMKGNTNTLTLTKQREVG